MRPGADPGPTARVSPEPTAGTAAGLVTAPLPPPGATAALPGRRDALGVTVDGDGAHVAVRAAGAEAVDVCVFDEVGAESRIRLPEQTFHVFHGFVPGLSAGTRYGLRVHGPWDPARGQRFNAAKLLVDPYAKAITGSFTDHPATGGSVPGDDLVRDDTDSAPFVGRSVAVLDRFDWGTDAPPATPWGDSVLYELHVKGFTARHPGIPPQLRGTYAGLAHPAALDYLRQLGITAVELLPIHQFVSEQGLLRRGTTNYWGYNTLGYFAPHAGYSASGSLGSQVTEFKQLVRAFHDAGLEVILDVVYNHTAEGNENGPTLSWRGIDNSGYYRLTGGGRRYADLTGTGNTVDTTSPVALQLVTDSLRYWVQEMHVDGFRFDLATALARGHDDVDMRNALMCAIGQDPVLRQVKLIAEPWDVAPGGYQVGRFPPPWSEWNGKYRDRVRDFWRGHGGVGELGWRLSGSADLYGHDGRRPYASVNFVTVHDGFTMLDLVSYDAKHNLANGEDNRDGTDDNRSWNSGAEGGTRDPEIGRLRRRRLRSILTTLLLSTGVPLLLAGDERGRTQGGNNNAYCQDNEVSWLDWELQPWQDDLLAFTRRVLAIRAGHPSWRQRHFFDGKPATEGGAADLAWLGPDGTELTAAQWRDPATATLGMFVNGQLRARGATGQRLSDSSFLLLLHGADSHRGFVLPGPPYGRTYRRLVDTADEHGGDAPWTDPAGATVMLAPFSAVLLRVEEV
ncbi:MAG: glycogen debranching enzyme GlgX [Actinomycetota bacterium]|nr:MAG: glycogen debranching enzyme GlgX [Actinomycetota bacterium]